VAYVAEAAALDRTNEVRTGLLNAVSHDLRTPLGSIKASVSSLRATDVTWSAEQAAEFVAAIEDDTDSLNQLVGNLLDMSRLQTGGLKPQVRRTLEANPPRLQSRITEAGMGYGLKTAAPTPPTMKA